MALREARVWGAKERLFERVVPLLVGPPLAHLVEAASVCDGIVKGLKHPDWPLDAWDALQRLALMVTQHTAAPEPRSRCDWRCRRRSDSRPRARARAPSASSSVRA